MKNNTKEPKEDSSAKNTDRMATLVLTMLAVVAVVGLVSVWYDSPSAALSYRTEVFGQGSFLCRYDADCAFNEICAPSKQPNNWVNVCRKSHQCERDQDCMGLGSSPSLMQCVNNWCKNKWYS